MPDLTTIGLVVIVFILAGLVKGVIGLGLPTISLALLTVAIAVSYTHLTLPTTPYV